MMRLEPGPTLKAISIAANNKHAAVNGVIHQFGLILHKTL
jgi:hypothetical protein